MNTRAVSLLEQQRPERVALMTPDGPYTYGDLEARARSVEAGLRGLGVGPGDRVAVWLPNTAAWLELFFACCRIGAILVSVNTRFRSSEVQDIVGRSGARVLVFWPGFLGIDFLRIASELDRAEMPRLESIFLYLESSGAGVSEVLGLPAFPYEELTSAEPQSDLPAVDPDQGSIIFTTSGTTRAPKFVLHSQAALVRHAHQVADAFGYRADHTTLAQALPFCGVFGFCQMLAALAAGRTSHLLSSFSAAELVSLVKTHRITHTHGTDDMWRAMFEQAEPGELSSLRACGFAAFTGAPLELVTQGSAHGVFLVGLYGMSEVQAFFAARSASAPERERARSGGTLTSPIARARVRDPASGELLGAGQQGELEVQGPSMMLGYFGNAEATAETMTEDGYVRTGDLAVLAEDGSFEYLARMGDALRLGGFLVSPAEIEAHLELHEAVEAAQVVGVDSANGPRCCAFVIGRSPATVARSSEAALEGALRKHCEQALAKFKVPERVFVLTEFPTTASANGTKIQKARLREIAEQALRA